MFKVQPVRSRELQAQLAALLNVPFFENTYAFYAGETNEDGTEITAVIGLCQFEFSPDKAKIVSIASPNNDMTDEAVFIMVRTVMNYCYRADIPTIVADDNAADEEYIKTLGFRKDGGEWSIDLKKFYRSPCHYNKDEK